jgi:nucleoid DNA-binding protein
MVATRRLVPLKIKAKKVAKFKAGKELSAKL